MQHKMKLSNAVLTISDKKTKNSVNLKELPLGARNVIMQDIASKRQKKVR